MAVRPLFVPNLNGLSLVREVQIEFKWNPGMAISQKRKNIRALHDAARIKGYIRVLEISSKSENEIGRRLSAFSLRLQTLKRESVFLESAYQASKVFKYGGPYRDILSMGPREAKKDPRIRNSGDLVRFEFDDGSYPLSPKNAFYDWLYLRALSPRYEWIREKIQFDGFTDIEFNPKKSINCQARAFAEFISLSKRETLERAVGSFEYFRSLLHSL
jgi:hypothetical protein